MEKDGKIRPYVLEDEEWKMAVEGGTGFEVSNGNLYGHIDRFNGSLILAQI
jgi:hypothetical protein